MLTLHMDISGVDTMLKVVVDRMNQLDKPLRQFDKEHKRPAVDATFKEGRSANGEEWAPLSKRGAQQKAARIVKAGDAQSAALRNIGGKLAREERRAGRRVSTARTEKQKASREKSLARRQLVRATFDALTSGNVAGVDTKAMQRLFKRIAARQVKIEAHAGLPLGKIAQSISSTVQGSNLTIESAVKWSAVHNDGGTAGRGAKEPKRTFLEWTKEDHKVLSEMLVGFVAE